MYSVSSFYIRALDGKLDRPSKGNEKGAPEGEGNAGTVGKVATIFFWTR